MGLISLGLSSRLSVTVIYWRVAEDFEMKFAENM